jgi:hypothetical protein
MVGSSEWGEGNVFQLEKGPQRVVLKLATEHPLKVEKIIVTNDLGFRPKGIVDYLPADLERYRAIFQE